MPYIYIIILRPQYTVI